MDDHTAYRPPGGSILYHATPIAAYQNTLPYQGARYCNPATRGKAAENIADIAISHHIRLSIDVV